MTTHRGTGLPFGIDFGGSGIKGAPVDLEKGDFAEERVRIDTPQPATPGRGGEGLLRAARAASTTPTGRSA